MGLECGVFCPPLDSFFEKIGHVEPFFVTCPIMYYRRNLQHLVYTEQTLLDTRRGFFSVNYKVEQMFRNYTFVQMYIQ
jgi:hypothetical protein